LKFNFVQNVVCFKVFDNDQDGYLSKDEISKMVDVMLFICDDNVPTQNKATTDESSNICNTFFLVVLLLFVFLS